jgi:hypothetical protein
MTLNLPKMSTCTAVEQCRGSYECCLLCIEALQWFLQVAASILVCNCIAAVNQKPARLLSYSLSRELAAFDVAAAALQGCRFASTEAAASPSVGMVRIHLLLLVYTITL